MLGVADAGCSKRRSTRSRRATRGARCSALGACVEQGRDAGAFASDLEVRARELLVVQTLGEVPAELSLTPEADAALQAQAERVEHAVVVRLLELLGEAMEGVRAGADPRTRLELALVKAARPEVDASTRALLARIERLERARGAAPAAAPSAAGAAAGAARRPGAAAAAAAPTSAGPPTPPSADARCTSPPPRRRTARRQRRSRRERRRAIAREGACGPRVAALAVAGGGRARARRATRCCGAVIEEAGRWRWPARSSTVAFAATAPFLKRRPRIRPTAAIVTDALRERHGRALAPVL